MRPIQYRPKPNCLPVARLRQHVSVVTTLIGKGGDDWFYVHPGDTVVGGAGIDIVITYWSGFTLPDDVENLVVTGTGCVGTWQLA